MLLLFSLDIETTCFTVQVYYLLLHFVQKIFLYRSPNASHYFIVTLNLVTSLNKYRVYSYIARPRVTRGPRILIPYLEKKYLK